MSALGVYRAASRLEDVVRVLGGGVGLAAWENMAAGFWTRTSWAVSYAGP